MRSNLGHIVVPGTVIWLVGFLVLLFLIPTLRQHDQMIYLWTALAGWILGVIGLAIYAWQRWSARRGFRSSNAMALDEEF